LHGLPCGRGDCVIKSKDLTLFGQKLISIRESLGYSKMYVSQQTGIRRDTISDIENGKTTPRFDTLDLLSIFYKVNLHLLFETTRKVDELTNLYNFIDRCILKIDSKNMSTIRNEYNKRRKEIETSNNLVSGSELEQFDIFIDLIERYYNNNINDYNLEIAKIKEALSLESLEVFQHNSNKQVYFSFLNIRNLIILSTLLMEVDRNEDALNILYFIYNEIDKYSDFYDYIYMIKTKTILNLSYINHLNANHKLAYKWAVQGIEFAKTNNSMYLLGELFARLGVSKLNLDYEESIDINDFKKAITLFEIQDSHELAETYKDILREMYDINLE